MGSYKGVWNLRISLHTCADFFYFRLQGTRVMISYNYFLDQLLEGYKGNYDVERFEGREDGLVATAHMHVLESQCIIFEELKMWDANADEYVYIFRIPHLTEEAVKTSIKYAYDDGFPKIDLDHVSFKHQHMCTHLVALFISDEADEAAIKAIKKCRIYKSFQFSLKGWMEMHTDLLTLCDEKVYANRYGKETAKYLKMHVDHFNKTNM